MTPKEKAEDLVDKFSPLADYNECDFFTQRENMHKNAKHIALLCVEEILQTNPTIMGNSDDLITMIVQTKAYWYRVQEEIKRL